MALQHRSSLFLLTVSSLANCQAGAQEQPVQVIEVSGKALAVQKAIAAKRDQTVVSDGLSSDEIGSIPDFGLGEALERVPGVSMIPNNGRGEAQFMTLRGLNPDYNTVTLDGIALPGTETTRRTVSLDVIPSSQVRAVNVYKSFTPEMDGNAVGGITNLITRSAFDHAGFHASARADYAKWDAPKLRSHTPSGEFEGTVSNTFGADNAFGLLLSGSFYRRVSSSLNTAIDSYSYFATPGSQTNASRLPQTADVSTAFAMPDRLRWLTYDNVRTRRSLSGRFDYDGGGALHMHVGAGVFRHTNDEDRRAQWLQNATSAASRVVIGADNTGSAANGQSQTDYAKFDQKRELRYVDTGVDYLIDDRRVLGFTLAGARGSYQQDAQNYTFASANSASNGYRYTFVTGDVPQFTPNNPGYLNNPANFSQTESTAQNENSLNRMNTLRLSYAFNVGDNAAGWGYKTGLQQRDVNQRYGFDELKYIPGAGVTVPLSAVGASRQVVTPYSANGRSLLLVDPAAAAAYFGSHPDQYIAAPTNVQNSTQRDFSVAENVSAVYLMGVYRSSRWDGFFGLRTERTTMDADTFAPSPANQTTQYAPVSRDRSYTKTLPSAGLNYDVTPSFKVRSGASLTMGRPTYAALAQNSSSVSGMTITQTVANPDLDPRVARNLDLSLEWYPAAKALVAAGLFHKDIRNEIANLTSTQNLTVGGTVYQNIVTQAQNVGDAGLNGLELNLVNTRFSNLASPFNHFGAAFNYTHLWMSPSSVTMNNGSVRSMPSLMESPRSVLNASLVWGDGPYSGQLSYTHSAKTLITVSTTNPAQDIYYKSAGYVDAQWRYRPDKRYAIVLQAKNLGNTRRSRVTGTQQQLLNQEIVNGRALYAGATFSY